MREPHRRALEVPNGGSDRSLSTLAESFECWIDQPFGMGAALTSMPTDGIAKSVTESQLLEKLATLGISRNSLILRAIAQTTKSHQDQVRGNGVSTVEGHVFPVALDFVEYREHFGRVIKPEEVVAALLHDVPEDDPSYPLSSVERDFGPRVTHLVAPLTKPPLELFPGKTRDDQSFHRLISYLLDLTDGPITSREIKVIDNTNNASSIHLLREDQAHVLRKIQQSRNHFIKFAAALRTDLLAIGCSQGEAHWLEFHLMAAVTIAENWYCNTFD